MTIHFTKAEMQDYLAEIFPQVSSQIRVDCIELSRVILRLTPDDSHLRPGGTLSGPSIFALADVAAYVMTLARIGREALTVTTHCSIDFMRKPAAGCDLVARAQLLKLGRSLSVTDVLLFSDGGTDPVAHATLTYAIPPKQR